MGILIPFVAGLLFSLVPWVLAMRAISGVQKLRATLDGDRTVTHNAIQKLRSGVDQSRLDAQALGKGIATVATRADEAHAAIAILRGEVERLTALAEEQAETTIMEQPIPLTTPAAEAPPPTRRDGQNGAKEEQGPPDGRTLAGVGPEAERLRKAVIAIKQGIPHDEDHGNGSDQRKATHRANHPHP